MITYTNWAADSEDIRQVYSTGILSNKATITEGNSTEIDSVFTYNCTERDTGSRPIAAEQQTAKQTLTTSKNSIEIAYSNFPCHLTVNRDKLVSINRLGNCKKGERLTITANSFTKIDQPDGLCPL